MPYELKVEGVEEISGMLTKMESKAAMVAAQALYEGAGIVADSITANAKAIKTKPFKWASTRRGETRLPSPEEKDIILNAAIGIAKFEGGGTEVQTSVGLQNSGYAVLKNKTVPVPKIANAINSGTSFMKKQPFVRKAATSGGKKAVAAMEKYVEDAFDAIMNNK